MYKLYTKLKHVKSLVTHWNFEWFFYCKVFLSYRAPKTVGFSHPFQHNPIDWFFNVHFFCKFCLRCAKCRYPIFQIEPGILVYDLHVFQSCVSRYLIKWLDDLKSKVLTLHFKCATFQFNPCKKKCCPCLYLSPVVSLSALFAAHRTHTHTHCWHSCSFDTVVLTSGNHRSGNYIPLYHYMTVMNNQVKKTALC